MLHQETYQKDCIVKEGQQTVIYRQSFYLRHRWTDSDRRGTGAEADRRAQRLKSAVQHAQRRGKRSRANSQKCLQYFAAGTTGTTAADHYEKTGSGIAI